jgi:hypothetical protein
MSSKSKQYLEDFDLRQLEILFKHVSLGHDHLKTILTKKQLADLFEWGDIRDEHKRQILATKAEKLGNMSLIINTILTSTFGAWMGLSGCIGFGLGSYKALTIISIIAFFVSGLTGYMSLNTTKQQAKLAIENQRLLNLQFRVLKAIISKVKEKINKQIQYLNSAIVILGGMNTTDEVRKEFAFETLETTYEWFEQLEVALQSRMEEVKGSSAFEFYQNQINQILYQIKKTFAKHIKYLENLSLTQQKINRNTQIMPSLPFLKILTNPAYGAPKYHQRPVLAWTKDNFTRILLGLTPTIWGGFASMFVFVGGIPNIARELGYTQLANFLIQPSSRVVEIGMALSVTSYFAFSFLYSYRKSWQRQSLLDQTTNEISTEETHLLEYSHKLNTLYKIKNFTQKIITIFNALKQVDSTKTKDHEDHP